jgi:hypothetical protein
MKEPLTLSWSASAHGLDLLMTPAYGVNGRADDGVEPASPTEGGQMGDRSQIAIKMPTKKDPDAKVYLYSHWGGADVYRDLQEVLAKRARWEDEEYLARMIFCRTVEGDQEGETGYGIGRSAHQDVEHLIPVIDCTAGRITFEMPEWEHNQRALPEPLSFEQFVALADPARYVEPGEVT